MRKANRMISIVLHVVVVSRRREVKFEQHSLPPSSLLDARYHQNKTSFNHLTLDVSHISATHGQIRPLPSPLTATERQHAQTSTMQDHRVFAVGEEAHDAGKPSTLSNRGLRRCASAPIAGRAALMKLLPCLLEPTHILLRCCRRRRRRRRCPEALLLRISRC